MNRKGASVWMYIVGLMVALALLLVLLFTVPSLRKGILDLIGFGPSEDQLAKQRCKTACETAGRVSDNCAQWKNNYCDENYNGTAKCYELPPDVLSPCVETFGKETCKCG